MYRAHVMLHFPRIIVPHSDFVGRLRTWASSSTASSSPQLAPPDAAVALANEPSVAQASTDGGNAA
jgi:hypothetical protein